MELAEGKVESWNGRDLDEWVGRILISENQMSSRFVHSLLLVQT